MPNPDPALSGTAGTWKGGGSSDLPPPLLVLAISFALRAWLACRGGQFFWPDEGRFVASQEAVASMANGQWARVAELLFAHPDHLLFKVFGMVPAALAHPWGDALWISALVFAAVSTWVLWLVHGAALAAGASDREARIALLLAAATNCLFYYSRHYFPYDLSLGFLLLAIIASLRATPGPSASLWVGIWAGLGFLTYNGYWSLVGAVLLLHVAMSPPQIRSLMTRAVFAAGGALLTLAAVIGIGRLLGSDLIARSVEFAGTVTQGDLGQARWFMLEYGWVSEHGLTILWALGLAGSLLAAVRARNRRTAYWPALCLLLAALLVLPSDWLHHFALNARHARVLAPFLCLATAVAISRPYPFSSRQWPARAILVLVVLQGAWNFARPLAQVFPPEFIQESVARLIEAKRTDLGPYRIVNATFLHNPTWVESRPEAGRLLLQHPHPFAFAPYLFEGYPAATRALYQSHDLTMAVVRLPAPGPTLKGLPAGMLDLTLRFPEVPVGLSSEPLIGSGTNGRGDLLFIEYKDEQHFRFGLDHWGGGATFSETMTLDRKRPHRLLVSLGSFYPQGSPLASRLFVQWDDTVAFQAEQPFHSTAPELISIGQNFIGASTAVFQTSALFEGIGHLPLPVPGGIADNPAGAFRLTLQLPSTPGAFSYSLVRAGPPDEADSVVLRAVKDNQFVIAFSRAGADRLVSPSFSLDISRPVELIVGLGAPAADPAQDALPTRLFVSCNGQVIFNRPADFRRLRSGDFRIGETPPLPDEKTHPYAQVLSYGGLAGGPLPAQSIAYPGAVRMRIRPMKTPTASRAEPLFATGRTGAGDLLFLVHQPDGRIRIGLDHWNFVSRISAPIELDRDGTLDLTILMGSLFSPADKAGAMAAWAERLVVTAWGRVVLNEAVPFYPANGAPVAPGVNLLGFSTTSVELQADVLAFEPVPIEKIPSLPPPP